MDLQTILNKLLQGQVADKISQKTKASPADVQKVIQVGLPILIGQLAHNASTPKGSKELDAAITKDHSGNNLLDSLSGLFGEGDKNSDGEKILGHIFGDTKTAAQKVATKTNLDINTITKILSFIAPLVMTQLGKAKTSSNLDIGGLTDLLKNQTDDQGNLLSDLVTAFFDKNKDGSVMDDIMNMFNK